MNNEVFEYIGNLGLKLDQIQLNNFVDVLFKFYISSAKTQRARGKDFVLTMMDYVRLHNPKYLHVLARQFKMGRLHDFKKSKKAMVLSWQPGMIRSGLPMSIETACMCSRQQSRRNCYYQKGEKMDDKTKAKISKTKTGHTTDAETIAKIKEANKRAYAEKSDAEKAEINARKAQAAKERWARYHAEKIVLFDAKA
ncbi:hypothetical protein [Rhizobium sp.]|uniref:hypothetical protein n=1 Tax=Rhizobium sp. TaxID=391 RepID=UPI0034C6BCBE